MLTAIITDQHFGCRKNSKLFHDYFLKFYQDIFFPTIEKNNIEVVLDLGDTFDNRKMIDFCALDWAKTFYYDKLQSLGCKVYTVVGNHTAYYKNTNSINAIDLLLREYNNVHVISNPVEITIGNLPILFVPWINQENQETTFNVIKKSKCEVAMGHLELSGFAAHIGHIMEEGQDKKIFNKYKKVFSGHYHTRSNDGKIFYLGNPYEIYWNDVNDTRGFHIFDTDTLNLKEVNNPYRLYYQVYYDDTNESEIDFSLYKEKIVKLIVKKKTNSIQFEKFVDNFYDADVADLKIVENFNTEENFIFEELESEHTLSIVNKYIQESSIDLEKSRIKTIFQDIYKEACELV